MSQSSNFFKALGPGLLFAAAAVGVSHLVQSTRAGASHGLVLLVFILLANLLKYPAFRFGPQYAAATGTSLAEGYRRQGRWALGLYFALTLATMFTVLAAVTLVTAALLKVTLGLAASPVTVSAWVLLACAALLGVGEYRWLDRITKVLVAVLTVSTVVAAALVLPRIGWSGPWLPSRETFDAPTVMFIAALFGWMPSAIDVSVWQSLWTLERGRDSGHKATMRESMTDFHIGYIGTVILAICFLLLGAGVMYGSGVALEATPTGFAAQVVNLYTQTLGEWARPLIGISATAVMFSTTLTVVDGFPRAVSVALARLRTAEVANTTKREASGQRVVYWLAIGAISLGAIALLQFFLASFRSFIDLATTLSFLTAPMLSWLNHRCITAPEVPLDARPAPWLRTLSIVGITGQGLFAAFYVWLLISR